MIQFVNQQLGYACGPERKDFFLSFECIHMAVEVSAGRVMFHCLC